MRDLSDVFIGHAPPDKVQTLTQALIDGGKLPPPGNGATTEQRIRTMMTDYGLGFDCAGYTQQAFLDARGVTRAEVRFASGARVEGLDNLPSQGFKKVAPEDARAGDIVVLDAPSGPGHRLVVYDRRDLSADEVASLRGTAQGASLAGGG